MGNVAANIAHSAVMPEVLVEQDNRFLLVRGQENGRTFWWPPGAYWINAGTCDLHTTDPTVWIAETLKDQIDVDVTSVVLKGVSLIDDSHAPVLVYSATISGQPHPNNQLGFDEAEFFSVAEFPDSIGRDEVHGRWLHDLIGTYTAAA
jgi:hypothetical protein